MLKETNEIFESIFRFVETVDIFNPIAVDKDDIAIRYIVEKDETEFSKDEIVDVFEPIILERLIKFRLMVVEKVDIVETRLSLRVDVFDPVVVDSVDSAICVIRVIEEIVEVRLLFVVDVFEPELVESVESASRVAKKLLAAVEFTTSKLWPVAIDRVEIDSCKLEKLEPAIVDSEAILLSIYVRIPLFPTERPLLKLLSRLPITVEKLDTDSKIPCVLRLEKIERYMREILDAFVEIPVLTSKKVGAYPVDIFDIEDDKFPAHVERFHPVCVDKVLKVVDIPVVVMNATELMPVLRI